jgi:hypothetical protein
LIDCSTNQFGQQRDAFIELNLDGKGGTYGLAFDSIWKDDTYWTNITFYGP